MPRNEASASASGGHRKREKSTGGGGEHKPKAGHHGDKGHGGEHGKSKGGERGRTREKKGSGHDKGHDKGHGHSDDDSGGSEGSNLSRKRMTGAMSFSGKKYTIVDQSDAMSHLKPLETVTAFQSSSVYSALGTNLGNVYIFDSMGNFVIDIGSAHAGAVHAIQIIEWLVVTVGADKKMSIFNWLTRASQETGATFDHIPISIAVPPDFNQTKAVFYVGLKNGDIVKKERGFLYGYNDSVVFSGTSTGFLGGLFSSRVRVPALPIRNLHCVDGHLVFSWNDSVCVFDLDDGKVTARLLASDKDLDEADCQIVLREKVFVFKWGRTVYRCTRNFTKEVKVEARYGMPAHVQGIAALEKYILVAMNPASDKDTTDGDRKGKSAASSSTGGGASESETSKSAGRFDSKGAKALSRSEVSKKKSAGQIYIAVIPSDSGDSETIGLADSFYLPASLGGDLVISCVPSGINPHEVSVDIGSAVRTPGFVLEKAIFLSANKMAIVRQMNPAEEVLHVMVGDHYGGSAGSKRGSGGSGDPLYDALSKMHPQWNRDEIIEIVEYHCNDYVRNRNPLKAIRLWAHFLIPLVGLKELDGFKKGVEALIKQAKSSSVRNFLNDVHANTEARMRELEQQRKSRIPGASKHGGGAASSASSSDDGHDDDDDDDDDHDDHHAKSGGKGKPSADKGKHGSDTNNKGKPSADKGKPSADKGKHGTDTNKGKPSADKGKGSRGGAAAASDSYPKSKSDASHSAPSGSRKPKK